ncbi:hypothetical protein [Paenibacillus sp. 22594]|uniref:hypothetical protein n=1 Tax=Paenibacillus sp. 22594 TaxID=3453947 RepID=UPI003F832100
MERHKPGTIPEGVSVPMPLKEMVLPGGLYAMFESSEDVNLSWKTFMARLAKDENYKSDRSRLCLEEQFIMKNQVGVGASIKWGYQMTIAV